MAPYILYLFDISLLTDGDLGGYTIGGGGVAIRDTCGALGKSYLMMKWNWTNQDQSHTLDCT